MVRLRPPQEPCPTKPGGSIAHTFCSCRTLSRPRQQHWRCSGRPRETASPSCPSELIAPNGISCLDSVPGLESLALVKKNPPGRARAAACGALDRIGRLAPPRVRVPLTLGARQLSAPVRVFPPH